MSFTSDVSRIAKKMGVNAETLAEASIIELFSSVIADTPVLEGRLRGNWQTTKGSPANGEIDRKQKEKRSGVATMEAFTVVGKPGTYFLTNNLPYAHRVEFEGHSKVKAPRGMVRINAKRIKQIVRKKASGLN